MKNFQEKLLETTICKGNFQRGNYLLDIAQSRFEKKKKNSHIFKCYKKMEKRKFQLFQQITKGILRSLCSFFHWSLSIPPENIGKPEVF